MRICFSVLLILSTTICFAQSYRVKDRILNDPTWREAVISTWAGSIEAAQVRYDDASEIAHARKADKEYSYGPADIAGFHYFDKTISEWRYFNSIKDGGFHMRNAPRHFYELVMDLQSFSVRSRIQPLADTAGAQSTKLHEVIYLHDKRTEKFLPFMKIDVSESRPKDPEGKLGQVDFDTLEQILGPEKLTMLKTYAIQNKLDWNRKDHLFSILAKAD